MNHLLRRTFAALATFLVLLAVPAALATPTISFTPGQFPATGSPAGVVSTPAGLNVSVTAAPTGGATISQVVVSVNGTSIGTATGSSPFTVNWVPTASGTYTIAATVTDTSAVTTGASANNNTATISSIVTIATARAVTIVAPANNANVTTNSQIFLRSSASMSDGVVQTVDFYLDSVTPGNLIGSASQAPYNVAYTVVATTGAHTLIARATASDGTTTFDSAPINFTVSASVGTPPTVAVSAPAAGSSVATGVAVTLTATASSTNAGGFIPSTTGGGVTFYVDGEPVGTDLTAPYSVSWTPSLAKVYSIRAQTTDDKGNTALSSGSYTVTAVASFAQPTISFTPPTTVPVNAPTVLTATAVGGTGSTGVSVQFLSGGSTILGTSSSPSSPNTYTFSWTPTTTGTVSLSARVTDTPNNNTATSAATNVTVSSTAPSVTINTPANGATLAGNSSVAITATATAVSPNVVASVSFFVDGNLIGTDTQVPYAVTWTAAPAGLHVITAIVVDTATPVPNTAQSSSLTVTVGAISTPTVAITAPIPGASSVVGSPVTVTANAAPGTSGTVSRVDFFADGIQIGTDATAPYSITWTPTAAGAPNLTAKVTDSAGVSTTSSPIPIVVNAAGTPTVTLSLVGGGGSLIVPVGSSRMLVAATADDGVVDHVDFFLDGTLIGTDGVAPYTLNYVAGTDVGPHQFSAVVTDNSGLTTTSNTVAVSVVAAIGSAPNVRVLTPTDGAFATSGSVTTINVIASDSDGTVSRVEVFANGILLTGTTFTSGIWSTAWTPTVIGPVAITAIATDDKTNAVVSASSNVTVTDSTAPTIVLGVTPGTNATTGTTLPAGATRNVLATVTSSVAGRAITRVEFFINGTKVGEKVTAPYSYRYTAPSAPGIYVLSARATDNAGLARDVYYTLTVTSAVGVSPTIRLLTPTNNTTVIPNTAVTMAASATATGGTIANVQFYADGSPVGTPLAPPVNFTTTYTPTTPGTHVLDAIATDDRGNTTVSNSVNLTAAFGTPTITISSPSTNVTARATPNVPFAITVTATPGTGASVFLVEFLVDGQQVGTRLTPTTANGSTYTFQWTPTAAQLGAHQITARITDTNSLSATTAATLNVNVANPVGAPPTLSNLAPANGAILQSLSTVNFAVTATPGGNATITSVEFFLNDVSIGTGAREQTTNVYRRIFDLSTFDLSGLTVNETTGRYPVNYYAVARDSNGNQTILPVPTATNPTPAVLNISPSTSSPPSVTLQSFAGTGSNAVTIGTQFFMIATPVDNDGTVTSMQLFVNGSASGPAILNPQPGLGTLVTYTPAVATNYNLYVVATDDTGNTAVSTPSVILNVTAIPAPITALVRPTDAVTTTTVGAPVFLEATASGANVTQVPTVTFVASATTGARTNILGTRVSTVGLVSTYRAIWSPTLADTYTVVSSAAVGTSPAATSNGSRRVIVNNLVGIAPTVTISVPNPVSSASTANLTATANDADGAVSSVEFFVNRISVGFATRNQLTNTWRLSASFVGQPLGATEIVALARDSSDNVAASPTSTINVAAATSLAPTITSITATPNSVATSRQVQLTANARDTDGSVIVQYFANGVNVGTGFNANTSYLVNWTPTVSGTYTISAVATDNSNPANTAVATPITVTVRRNNPIQDDTSFIIQSYSDIANTTNINPLVLADLADQLAAGTTTRAEIVTDLTPQPGFVAPVNLLAAYWVLMGQWPTPANYTNLLATARNSLPNAVGSILSANEYFAKYGAVPTLALLNNPASVIPADTFIARLWAGAGLGTPSALDNLRFRSNDTASATVGRGYNATGVGLNTAIAEFITNTNSTNTALFAKARAAALYYQLDRPPTPTDVTAKSITDAIAVRIDALVKMPDDATRVDSLLKDILYTYRYVTFLKQPQSLVVSPRSGAIFTVEAMGAPPIIYQWLFNGTPIANATTSTLSLTNVDTTRVGTYTVVVTTTAGSATSDPATLTLSNAITRVANISTRGVTSGGNQSLIAGFVVTNPAGAPANQTRQMLIRVVGPGLTGAPFNVTGALANPSLDVYNGTGQLILTNDNWGAQSANAAANTTAVTALQQATNRLGTFTLANGSLDSAVLATLPPGNYTVQAGGPNANSTGVVLVEVYDATAGNATATSPKAANVATRGEVGTGTNVLIAGFVINGTTSRRMLIRGVGPTLRNFGLGQAALLADPFLTLKDAAGTTIRTNDDWASGDDAAVIAAAAVSGGAFPLANGSKDAAMIIMLAPGAYTVQLSGVNNTTGIGIVEVYDVDP